MAVREIPVSSHLLGTGVQELRNLRLWQLTGTPASPTEGIFWFDTNTGNKRIYFYDAAAGAAIPVPRVDRAESLTGQWAFAPAAPQAPFTLNSNAQGQKVIGFNADLLDGFNSDASPNINTIIQRDGSGRATVQNPSGLTDIVNLQSLNATIAAITISASQVTSGTLPLTRGGTGADLSAAGATGGLVWKNGSALAITGALVGILVGTGASAPTAITQVPITLGGTNATTISAARANLDVLWSDDVIGYLANRAPVGGVVCDGTATSKIVGTTGINAGLFDFTASFRIRFPTYTPASVHSLFTSHSTGNNRFTISLKTNGDFELAFVDNAAAVTAFTFTPDVAMVAGSSYTVTFSCTRSGSAVLYINGVSDRDKSGAGVSSSIASTSSINIGSGNANPYTSLFNCAGVCSSVRVFNRALAAADVLSMAQVGLVDPSDQWAGSAAAYTSNFSAGTDSFSIGAGLSSLTGNVDSITDGSISKNDTLRLTTDSSTGFHFVSRNTLSAGKRYRVALNYYIPSGQTANGIRVGFSAVIASGFTFDAAVTGAWTAVTGEFTETTYNSTLLYISMLSGSNSSFAGVSGEVSYVRDIVVTEIGAVLDLDLQLADPSKSLTVRDRSVSENHGTAAASGITQISVIKQINVEQLALSGVTLNRIVYIGASNMVSGLAVNSGAIRFLTQASSGAPVWTDLFSGNNTWTGTATFTSTVTVPLSPTNATDATSKGYVDSAVSSGLRPLVNGACQLATTANISLAGEQTIDGVLTSASRVLVKDQSTASQNGVYVSAAGAWSRSTDADSAAEITKGAYVYVTSGTLNSGTSWYETATVTTINTDPVNWIKFFQQAAYIAGAGINITGQTLSVDQSFSPAWTGAHTFANSGGVGLLPYGASAGNTTDLRFFELAANGMNYVGFKAPDTLSANTIWVLPTADGSAGYYLRTDGSKVLSFAQIASTEINNSTFLTSLTGVAGKITVTVGLSPSITIDSGYVGQASLTTLGTITTGVWNASVIPTLYGGTNNSIWVAGDVVYASSSSALAGVHISGTSNKFLQSDGTTPSWSAYTLPASVAVNQLLYGSSSSAVSALAAVASRVLVTDGSGNISWGNTLPTGLSVAGDTASKITKIKWFDVGDGSSTTITLTHNFATRDVVVDVYEALSGYRTTFISIARTTINTVDVEFAAAPASNAFRCAILAAI